MKKKTLLHFWLLLCLMVAGATNAWADEVTYTFTSKSWNALIGQETANWTSGKDGAGFSNNGVQVTSNASGANATSPVSYDNISKIVVTYNTNAAKGAGTLSVQIGENEPTVKDWKYSGSANGTTANFTSEFTYDTPQSGYVKLTANTTTNSIYVVSVAITYSASDPGLETSDLALTGAPVALNFDLYNNASAQVINYTTSSTGAVTIPESDYATFAIDEENKTITVTPKAVTPEAQTITVSQAADESYNAGSTTFTVTISDSTPIPTHTATFSVNGATSTEDFEEGAAIEFPENPATVEEKVFVGWTTEAIDGVTDEAPAFVTEATMGESDVTFYAVFATSEGGSAAVTDELTYEVIGVTGTSYSSWEDKTASSDAVYAGQTAGGNNAIQLRSNNNNSGIVSTTSGGKLAKVAVEWNSSTDNARILNVYGSKKAYSSASDLYGNSTQGTLLGTLAKSDGDKSLIIKGDYDYVGVRSSSGALYLASLSITWGGGATLSGYCTTVAADTREEAGISFAEAAVTKEIVDNYTGQALNNPNSLTVAWASSNEDVATVENGVVTMKAVGETTITASFAGDENYKKATVSYTLTVQDSREAIELVFAEESVSVNVTETVAAPELTGNTGNGTVSYESSNPEVATVDEDGVVTGVADGTATITATVAATNEYQGGTATFTVTVVEPNKKGTQTNPYSVAEAIDAIDNGGDVTGVYAQGIVSEIVTEYSSTYHNISYNISADGTTDGAQLQAFRGKSYNGENFTSAEDIQVGDVVVVYGDLIKYNTTYEFAQNNQLVSRVRKATPTLAFTEESYTVEKNGELTITAETNSDATIVYTSSDPEVADINAETGVVTAKEAGTTTITATVAETANFKSASVEIELTVTDPDLAMDITLNTTGNGNIECDKEKANEGETVTLTATPDEGYKLTGWTIIDGEANEVEYVADGNIATFTMPATDVEVEASFAEIKYFDVVFSVAGEEYGDGETVEEGATLTLPEDPTIEGVTFAGWSTSDDVTAPVFVSNATVVEDDMILTAMFIAKAGETYYQKVTADNELTDGQYLIVYEDGNLVFDGSLEKLDVAGNLVNEVTINDAAIAPTDKIDAATFTIDMTAGTIQSASGFYIGQTSNANGLISSEETAYTNTISIDEGGNADIVSSGGAYLRYNSTSGQTRFRYYKSSSYTSQKAIALYKKTATAPVYFDGSVVESLALNDVDGYTGTATVFAKKVVLTRTVKANTWSSFVAPFDINKTDLAEEAEVKVLASSEIKENGDVRLNFEDAATVEAGVPFMVRLSAEKSSFEFENVFVMPAGDKKDAETQYANMVGTYEEDFIPAGAWFFSNNKFYNVVEGSEPATKAFRGYFTLHDVPAEARMVAFGLDGEVTRIDGVNAAEKQFTGDVYDLSGRKVAQPARGLYIVNGKKVVIK